MAVLGSIVSGDVALQYVVDVDHRRRRQPSHGTPASSHAAQNGGHRAGFAGPDQILSPPGWAGGGRGEGCPPPAK